MERNGVLKGGRSKTKFQECKAKADKIKVQNMLIKSIRIILSLIIDFEKQYGAKTSHYASR